MKMIDFEEVKRFLTKDVNGYNDSYRRVSPNHPFNLMLGIDKAFNPSLLLITESFPNSVEKSIMINITVGKRADGKYSLVFSLLDDKYLDLFCYFCEDLINSSVNCSKEDDASFICERYLLWKKMLEKTKYTFLSANETKGLIGELYFLKEFLFKKYGINEAIQCWLGPKKADQDFICNDVWYEVKTTSPGAITVKISSIEQLDSANNGNLVVLFMDISSSKDSNKLNLNNLVKEIHSLIEDEITESKFNEILLESGYVYNEEYNNRNYHFVKANMYNITQQFPCLRQGDVPSTVGKVNYELILNKIDEWGILNGFTRI